jgi:hypothetical protein
MATNYSRVERWWIPGVVVAIATAVIVVPIFGHHKSRG